jgi:RNA polymerase sigma-70 factor (sigma-E family)
MTARGDSEFVEFVEASSVRLLRAAYLLTGDRHQAEDDVQTTLARTYSSWSRVRRQDAYSYARKVLANHVIDRWRRPMREHPDDNIADVVAPDSFVAAVVEQDWLMRALARLSARERAIVVMRHYWDLSEADVAAELKVSLGTVKSTSSRALAKMRLDAGQTVQAGEEK